MKNILDFDFKDKNVIIRCDLNVTTFNNKIVDDTRIVSSVKSIKYILDNGGKAIILSHFGKVKEEADKDKYSLRIVYERLKDFIPSLKFCSDIDFDKVRNFVDKVDFKEAVLLENTRFYDLPSKLESSCNSELYNFYSSLGDIFILDAFGSLHRKHASTYGISSVLPTGIGFLVMEEIKNLDILFNPKRPFAVVMGGAKISDKISVINSLIDKVDLLLIGGAMANTFLVAKGYSLGKSLYEEDMIDTCVNLLKKYSDKIVLPIDFYGCDSYENKSPIYIDLDKFNQDLMCLDIGNKSVNLFLDKLKDVKFIFWNGPLGVTDFDNYCFGTKSLLEFISKKDIISILGGGDVVGACKKLGYQDFVTFLSTGGGATLDYIANGTLVSLENLKR